MFESIESFKSASHTSWSADRTTLLKLYRSLVGSKLDYGCIIYGSARKSYLQMLDPMHNQGLRLALGAFRTSPVASLYVEADEPSLYSRREKLSLQYAIRLAGYPSNPAHEAIPVRSHTFVEIDHEIISTVILLPSADLFKNGCCQLQAKVCA